MTFTRLSTKGQVILPKEIRDSHRWKPGTRFLIEEIENAVILRAAPSAKPYSVDDVYGCLHVPGKRASLRDMERAIAKEVKARHGRGRY